VKAYSYGSRVQVENTGVRHPFRDALLCGDVPGWERCVVLEDMPVSGHKTAPDLVALREDGQIALIECKRASSGQAKKGMFEQVLMYGEILRPLLEAAECATFEQQCRRASNWSSEAGLDSFVRSTSSRSLHLWVVVDRWSGRMDQTARYTWEFLNKAMAHEGRPPIRVWAVGHGGSPVDVADARADWAKSMTTASTTVA
jgi:hypothetical protein